MLHIFEIFAESILKIHSSMTYINILSSIMYRHYILYILPHLHTIAESRYKIQ